MRRRRWRAVSWLIGAYYALALVVMGSVVLVRVAQGSQPTPRAPRKPLAADIPAPVPPASPEPVPTVSATPAPVIQKPAPTPRESVPAETRRPTAPVVPPRSAGGPQRLQVVSTAYSYGCGGGSITASGAPVSVGIVAMNLLPLGSIVRIVSGPFAGALETVLDRIGWGSQIDFWVSSCWEARQYGRQWIEIEVAG